MNACVLGHLSTARWCKSAVHQSASVDRQDISYTLSFVVAGAPCLFNLSWQSPFDKFPHALAEQNEVRGGKQLWNERESGRKDRDSDGETVKRCGKGWGRGDKERGGRGFGTGCTLTAVPRSTQPSTLRGTVNEYQPYGWVIIHGDGRMFGL